MRTSRAIGVAAVALALGACASERKPEDLVREALTRTEQQARDFVYEEVAGTRRTQVRGSVEDVFRSHASVTVNGEPIAEVIDHDDARGVRALQGRTAGLPTRAGWVVDPTGAPDPLRAEALPPGQDPLYDARIVFDYARAAIDVAEDVGLFNPTAIEYRADEDPFPPPDEDAGEQRFDLMRPKLTVRDGPAGNQAVPEVQHFRAMAFYVRDGVVVRITESVDVISLLPDLERVYDTTFPPGSQEETARIALAAVNGLRQGQGLQPIRARHMTYEADQIGAPHTVALPERGFQGSVAFLTALVSPPTTPQPVAPAVPPVGLATGEPTAPPGSASQDAPAFRLLQPKEIIAPAEPVSGARAMLWMLGVPVVAAALLALGLRRRMPAAHRLGRPA